MNHAPSYLNKTEIARQLGYFPAFLLPAIDSPLIFRSLVQQTFSAYINNPLPKLFKEKLFVYLSRHFGVDYFTICHSCTLKSLGAKAIEILALAEIEPPQTEEEILGDLELLSQGWCDGKGWQNDPRIEIGLLRCACFIFLYPTEANDCIERLKTILGVAYYNYLTVFLGYIKLCHQWVASNPTISHEQDLRSQLHLGSLLLSETRAIAFFKNSPQAETTPVEGNYAPTIASQTQKQLAIASNSSRKNLLVREKLSLATLTSYLTHAPFPVAIHRQNGEILYLNHNWVEVTGYHLAEIPNLSIWQKKARLQENKTVRISSENVRQLKREISRLPQMGTQTQNLLEDIADSLSNLAESMTQMGLNSQLEPWIKSETSIITKGGKQLFWELYTVSLEEEGTEERSIVSIVKDVTEIKTKTDQLIETEDRLDLVLDATNAGSWNWHWCENSVELCARSRSILGLASFAGSYQSFLHLVHPKFRETVDLSLIKAMKTSHNLDLEFPVIRANYAICWIRLIGKLRYNFAREVIGVNGILMDVTRLNSQSSDSRLNAQLNNSNAQQSFAELAKAIDLFPAYIFAVEVDEKNISLLNNKLASSLGISDRQTAIGKSISDCFPADYARQIVWQQQQVLTYGRETQVQEEVTLADGVHYFDTTISPLKDERGKIYGLLHTSNEIPDLAATKEALSQRTLQLEAANKELESFSYSVSHDLQAPLRIINGFSQVLWENYQPHLDDHGRHYLQRIQVNSEKMSDLIDALLQLSRVTRSQMKSVRVNLSKIARDIIEELQASDPERRVEFTTTEDLMAKGDPQLLRIVLNNLLNNAWKYTSKKEIGKIEFNAIRDGDRLTYFVRDNGAGFDLEYADKLFTAFKRLHTQEEFPGTGIGLATVQRIVYRHGGKVWAEGECDRGATIYFSL